MLHSLQQVDTARKILDERGLSTLDTSGRAWLRRYGIWRQPQWGDAVKSWDVLKTIQTIEAGVARDAALADFGAYCSEVPIALSRLGWTNIVGLDLERVPRSQLRRLPFELRREDFMASSLPDAAVDVVTAISVIEHGYNGEALFAEVSRVLKPGGLFLASFDYNPEELDTSHVAFFGMSWTIFSERSLEDLLRTAALNGLHPLGEVDARCQALPIRTMGFDYTFGWLALKKI